MTAADSLCYEFGMRKLSARYHCWLLRRQAEAEAQRQRRFGRRIRPRGRKRVIVRAPQVLSFEQNPEATLKFFEEMREEVTTSLRQRVALMVDPARVRSISPATALCLLSEMDRWQRLRRKGPLFAVTLANWEPEVVRRLADMGFFEMLGTAVPDHLRDGGPGAARFIRFQTNTLADPRESEFFRHKVGGPLGTISALSLNLYRSIGEAIANCIEHAYPNISTFPVQMGRRWWLTGSIDIEKSRLSVVVLDHGISIPGSLPRSRRRSEILEILRRFFPGRDDDGAVIEAAMEYGRSRLNDSERGKGLGDVVALVQSDKTNRLRVISRNGFYVVGGGLSRSGTTAFPLYGTLIEWDLALPQMNALPMKQES